MQTTQDWVNAVLGLLLGAGGAFMTLRRRFSKDSAAIAQDRAETALMATLRAERDAAMRSAHEAWAQRTEDAKAIARFEALDEARERETKRLREEVFALRLHTQKLTLMLMKLDPDSAHLLQLGLPETDGIHPPHRSS